MKRNVLFFIFVWCAPVFTMQEPQPDAFHRAARDGCLSDIVELVYGKKNQVDELWILSLEPPQSVTALWLATAYGHKELVKKLIECGARKNISGPGKVGQFKNTPLAQAAINLERARRDLPCPRFCIGGGVQKILDYQDAEEIFYMLGGRGATTGLSTHEFARPEEMAMLTQKLLAQHGQKP